MPIGFKFLILGILLVITTVFERFYPGNIQGMTYFMIFIMFWKWLDDVYKE